MIQLLAPIFLVVMTVLMHGFGMLIVFHRFRTVMRSLGGVDPEIHHGQWLTVQLVAIMLAAHLGETALWALFYMWQGMLPDYATAIYFSLCSYTTVGYGDVVLPRQWRLLGALEAAVGMLMFGWSTGMLFAIESKVYQRRLEHPGKLR
jgi:hypothetical protein